MFDEAELEGFVGQAGEERLKFEANRDGWETYVPGQQMREAQPGDEVSRGLIDPKTGLILVWWRRIDDRDDIQKTPDTSLASHLPPLEVAALRVAVLASLTGHCLVCGAEDENRMLLEHVNDCPAGSGPWNDEDDD